MKKRNTVITTFLLLAAVTLGVGYATLSDQLTIGANVGAGVDPNNLIVVFDGETVNTPEVSKLGQNCQFQKEGSTSDASVVDGFTTAGLVVSGLTTKGHYADATLVVENRSYAADLDVTLGSPVIRYDALDESMFEITAEWKTSDTIDLVLEPGENIELYVKISLLVTPTVAITNNTGYVAFECLTA